MRGERDPCLDALEAGATLLAQALEVLDQADLPLVSSYVQLALDLSQAELAARTA